MITELEARILTWNYIICGKFFTIPLQWKDKQVEPKEHQHPLLQLLAWTLHIFVLGYNFVQLPMLIAKKEINGAMLHGIITLTSAASFVLKLSLWIYKDEIARVINQTLHSNSAWGETFLKLKFISCPMREKMLGIGIVSCLVALLNVHLAAVWTRNQAYSFYALIWTQCHSILDFLPFTLFLFIQAFLFLDVAGNFLINSTTVFLCCTSVHFWLQKICIDWPKLETRAAETCLVHYKGIYILNKDCNSSLGQLFVPFLKLLFILCLIVTFFAMVRLANALNLFALAFVTTVAVSTFAILAPMTIVMSSIFDISTQFPRNLQQSIQALTDTRRKKILEKYIKSCALVRCEVGSLYYMEAKAKLTLSDHIIQGIVFLLVNA